MEVVFHTRSFTMAPEETCAAAVDGVKEFYEADTDGLDTSELERVLLLGRQNQRLIDSKLMQIEGELMGRQPDRKSLEQPLALAELVQKLHVTARRLQAVDDVDVEEFHRSIEVIVASQKMPLTHVYRKFLNDI